MTVNDELLTVGQVAQRFGVTVRTLHHYDDIGLVVPTERSWSGYRLYTPTDICRLARVVLLRRLELPLAQIQQVLDEPSELERLLGAQRESITQRMQELSGLLHAIDTAIQTEGTMNDYAISTEEMTEIFGEGYDEAYEAEAQERWGETEAFKESRRRAKNYDKQTWARIKGEADDVMQAFAEAKRDGSAVDAPDAQRAVQAHRDHIEKWFNPVPLPMLRGMGQMFSADPRFAKTYNDVEPGLADFVSAAIAEYCRRVD